MKWPSRKDKFLFTSDGKAVVVPSMWDGLVVVPTDQKKEPIHLPIRSGDGIYAQAVFADSSRVALADCRGVIRIHDLRTGKQLDQHTRLPYLGGVALVGEHTAACWGPCGKVVTWDIRSGEVLSETTIPPAGGPPGQPFVGMRFSANGRQVAAWTEYRLCVLAETATGKRLAELTGAGYDPLVSEFHPSGKSIGTFRELKVGDSRFDLHDLATGRRLRSVPLKGGLVRFAPDGRTLLHATAWQVALREGLSGQPRWQMKLSALRLPKNESNELCLAELDRLGRTAIVVREQDAHVFDVLTGKIKACIPSDVCGEVCAVSASGRWLAARSVENEINLHDLEGKDPAEPVLKCSCPGVEIIALALDTDASRLLTLHGDATCLVCASTRPAGPPRPQHTSTTNSGPPWPALIRARPNLPCWPCWPTRNRRANS